jgi:hypothetical protein
VPLVRKANDMALNQSSWLFARRGGSNQTLVGGWYDAPQA